MASSKGKHVAGDFSALRHNVVSGRSSNHSHTHSRGSSTETILHHSSVSRNDNPLPGSTSGLRRTHTDKSAVSRTSTNKSDQSHRVIEITSCLKQVLGFPPIDAPRTHFDAHVTQTPNWKTPDNISRTIEYQTRRYRRALPKERSFENRRPQDHIFDPDKGAVYSGCTQCDPTGGPTDCQHPEDPRRYSTELNPIPKGDPAFRRCGPVKLLPTTPKKTSPGSRLISKPSPSKAAVTPETVSSKGCSSGFAEIACAKGIEVHQPDEMLAARHLSNFLTENVEPGVATSYIIFTTHGTLLGYSSPLPVTAARHVAATTGLTWRANDSALLRGTDIGPLTGGANLQKILETTQAEKGPGLFNMICAYKNYLMSVQWIKPGLLLAAMTELDEQVAAGKGKGKFSIGAGDSEQEGDEDWKDEGAVEETSEDDDDRAREPSKKSKLFHKSQAVASALREQWEVDNFKLPPGFR
ncbi:MAG: hypothetical protein L6R42_008191 [Xanthoria sp. 1 TBL-2021]|nr:MAG: hypothetical protein L6R42_008191 [Xanthoria sp. 1 TBL-2021]